MVKVLQDQMGYSIAAPDKVERIVCLVPSITELLCDLGLEDKIVGITKYCVHPKSCFESKVRVGGTKNFDVEAIKLLDPDIVIANKEENTRELLHKLKTIYPVWISDIQTVDEALTMIQSLGELFRKENKAQEILNKISLNFDQFEANVHLRVAYLIWRRPYMTINKDTYIHDIINRCGFINIFSNDKKRYPEIIPQDLIDNSPDVIMLSSEPYPFRDKHIEEVQKICPRARVLLVDGEMFSWYGSRMVHATDYLKKLMQQFENDTLLTKKELPSG